MLFNVYNYSNELMGQVEADDITEAWSKARERFSDILDVSLIEGQEEEWEKVFPHEIPIPPGMKIAPLEEWEREVETRAAAMSREEEGKALVEIGNKLLAVADNLRTTFPKVVHEEGMVRLVSKYREDEQTVYRLGMRLVYKGYRMMGEL